MTTKENYEEALEPISSSVIETLVKNRGDFQKYLSRRLDNPAIAEEILQQSLLKAVEHEGAIDTPESAVPWFYRILKNSLIDYFRTRSVDSRKVKELLQELENSDATRTSAPDDLKSAVCLCLGGLINTLKPEYAELIRKIDLQGLVPELVAKNIGITLNNLWVRLHRARLALKKSLERSCGACSKHACLNCTCEQTN